LTRAQAKIEELKGLRPRRNHGWAADERAGVEFSCPAPSSSSAKPIRGWNKLILTLFKHRRRDPSSAVASGEADLGIGFDFTKDSNLKVLARTPGKLGAG